MNANYTYNQTGEATGLEYKRPHTAPKNAFEYHRDDGPNIHKKLLPDKHSRRRNHYHQECYDAAQLTQVEETPPGTEPECKHRGYTYDEDTNRTIYTLYNDNKVISA